MAAAPTAIARNAATPFPRLSVASVSTSNKPGRLSVITRKQPVVLCSLAKTQECTAAENGVGSSSTRRREAMLQIAFSAVYVATATASPALALDDAPADFRVYSDDANKYKISIPQDWQVGAGETDGIKSITAFFPEEASTSNVSVVITGIGPDFTRLESFGKVDAFAESLVNGLDRSWQRPPGVAAKLIDCRASNGLYYIEYTLQNPGESRRHIYSAIGMANNGWYNRLYTVTGQVNFTFGFASLKTCRHQMHFWILSLASFYMQVQTFCAETCHKHLGLGNYSHHSHSLTAQQISPVDLSRQTYHII